MFRRYKSFSAVIAFATVLSVGCGPMDAEQPVDVPGTGEQSLGAALFYHDFRGDSGGSNSQCNGGTIVSEGKSLGEWTTRVGLDTDGRSGGCAQKLGISDPHGELSGLVISVDFRGEDGFTGGGQCDNPGLRSIPVTTGLAWTSAWGIDTDQRTGGCVQSFSLAGRGDVALDVKFEDENFNGQCGNAGLHTITSTRSASIIMNMDDRRGGCLQSFRLRKMVCGDNVCEFGESCEADCVRCGDGICNGTETESTCPGDCAPPPTGTCGDTLCEFPEDPFSCPMDCVPTTGYCGDNICDFPESQFNCPVDCGLVTCLLPPTSCP
ncbi:MULTISPECIES: hypothetical protein [Myxococcus]|uniref:hypothetical protein n=1 Tax=Myxococcus TaxID=32 RepID=UPI001596349B|nr:MULTISPECIES: hypothetical protein [Myxococcus]NVJ27220.1 hypothetical protein [Myxococcus sp. AM011]